MSINSPSILFQFMDLHTAKQATDTFEELGYEPKLRDEHVGQPPIVAIRVVDEDLTSALEIGLAFGGKLLEHSGSEREEQTFSMAYDMRGEEGHGDRLDVEGPQEERPGSDEGPLYDVSADTYDHFSGDVRA